MRSSIFLIFEDPCPPMTQCALPAPPPKPVLDPVTQEPAVETVEEVVVDPVTNEETTIEKEVPVMAPTPAPIKIVIPDEKAGDFFSEEPKKDVKAGAATMVLSCAAGAAFKAGDKITLGMGTPQLEVVTIGEVEMSPSCMETAGEAASVPCPKGSSWTIGNSNLEECSGKGSCDAGECICEVRYGGEACDAFVCVDGGDCLNGGTCETNSTQCVCPNGFQGERCNTTDSSSKPISKSSKSGSSLRFKTKTHAIKQHVEVQCIHPDGKVQRLNAEMAHSEEGPSYDLCEFFCTVDDAGTKFNGACQINSRKFTPKGTAYVDLDKDNAKQPQAAATSAAVSATKTPTLAEWHQARFVRLRARLRAADGGVTLTFTGPTKNAHSKSTPIFRNLEVPSPPAKPVLKPKPTGKPCGKEGTPESTCYNHGKCNKEGKCLCEENSKYWGGDHCGVSQCSRSCNIEGGGGKCIFESTKNIMECQCVRGWGGEFCFQEYCPNSCNAGLNYGKCVETKTMNQGK